jgi:hypothetical protein
MIFYNSYDIFLNDLNKEKMNSIPGGVEFSSYFQIFSMNISCFDRSGVMKTPMKVELLPHMKIPEYRIFEKSYEQICDDRAKEILNQCEQNNKKLAVMYSGGIDSTLVLCSILKVATKKQLNMVVVLLSSESIIENKNFYYQYIIKNFECVSSYKFPYYLGNDEYLFISGENADQLFGSQVCGQFAYGKDYNILLNPIENMEGHIIDFFNKRLSTSHKKYKEGIFNIFKKIVEKSPIEIDNVYKFFWWINFTTKWQSVYVRLLPFSNNIGNIKLQENYTTFYCTEEFQLWSLNNSNSFVKDTIDSVKYISKDYIYNFNKDLDYLKKPKVGSLTNLTRRKSIPLTLDKNMNYSYDWPDETNYNLTNDFKDLK